MKITLREELKKCKTNLRKMLTKRDRWIKDHPGQVFICLIKNLHQCILLYYLITQRSY